MTLEIRPAERSDAGTLVALVQALAVFEKEPVSRVKLTVEDVLRDGFSEPRRFEALIARWAGEPVGFALFFHNYSTWEGRAGIFVEDLFVLASHRTRGIGRALLAEIAGIARARDCVRVDLQVLDWNPARDFYGRLGFTQMASWLPYRLSGEAIAALADGARS